MAAAQTGDQVKVHYTGKLQDGTVFDSSVERDPLEFKLGEGRVIPGFEKAIIGMAPGDSKTAQVPSDEAYGPHRDEMVLQVQRDEIPNNIDPKVGDELQVAQPNGAKIPVRVTQADADQVTLDGNHPLAGQDLTFDIELVEIA